MRRGTNKFDASRKNNTNEVLFAFPDSMSLGHMSATTASMLVNNTRERLSEINGANARKRCRAVEATELSSSSSLPKARDRPAESGETPRCRVMYAYAVHTVRSDRNVAVAGEVEVML